MIQLVICDINPRVITAAVYQGFQALEGDIMERPGVLVSPANSFGWMDGGIDLVYSRAYPALQAEVQGTIDGEFNGELLVGQATSVRSVMGVYHPGVIVAPTMRTPGTDLRGSIAPYLAMRAILWEWQATWSLTEIPILCPGLGTASGGMDPDIALAQMRRAWDDVHQPPVFTNWQEAYAHEEEIRRGLG